MCECVREGERAVQTNISELLVSEGFVYVI